MAVFDLLTKPKMELTETDAKQVKDVTRKRLETIKQDKLVLDSRMRQQTVVDLSKTVRTVLDYLPRVYTTELYKSNYDAIYQYVYKSYSGEGESMCGE